MTLFDKVVVQMRDAINGKVEIDQNSMHYTERPYGPDFKAPWSLANVSHC